MRIFFVNECGVNERKAKLLRDAIAFAATELNYLDIARHEGYLLDIKVIKKFDCDTGKLTITNGQFIPVDSYYAVIRVRLRASEKDMLSVLFHEMQHAKQHVEGRLIARPGQVIWESKVWANHNPITYRDYRKLPWEVEARKVEKSLYRIW